MTSTRVHLNDLHFEFKVWNNELDFYRDEIGVFEHWLHDLKKRTTVERGARVEVAPTDSGITEIGNFRSRLTLEKERAASIKLRIRGCEEGLAAYAKIEGKEIEYTTFSDHVYLRDEVLGFRNKYHILKKDFFAFMERWI